MSMSGDMMRDYEEQIETLTEKVKRSILEEPGFVIICRKCNKELFVGSREFYNSMLFYVEREYDRNIIELSCNCGNKITDF